MHLSSSTCQVSVTNCGARTAFKILQKTTYWSGPARAGQKFSPTMNMLNFLECCCWLLAAAAALALYRWPRGRMRMPPGPRGLPVLGNLGVLATKNLHQELDRLSKRYGPIVSLRFGSKQALLVSSPAMAEQVLKTWDREFASRPASTAKDVLWFGDYTVSLATYGPAWRFGRRIYTTELLNLRRTNEFESVRAEELSAMVQSLVEDSNSGTALDMRHRIFSLVMNTMSRMTMNRRFYAYCTSNLQDEDPRALEYQQVIDEALSLTLAPVFGDTVPYLGILDRIKNYKKSMIRIHKRFDDFMQELVDEHRQKLQQQTTIPHSHEKAEVSVFRDLVDVMLRLPGEAGAQGLDEKRVKGHLNELLNAGSETTSTTIEWGLSELIRCPDVLKKVQSELDSVVGRNRVVVESDLDTLPYLQATVKEVLRLHPAAPLMVPHLTTQACQIGDYHIPAQTTTFINVWSIGRDPRVWDRPLEFLPDRFLNQDIDVRGQHFQLIPFGSGRRSCPGMHLALAVVHLTLARLAHTFSWSLPGGQANHHLDMDEDFHLTLSRANPLKALPRPRLEPSVH